MAFNQPFQALVVQEVLLEPPEVQEHEGDQYQEELGADQCQV